MLDLSVKPVSYFDCNYHYMQKLQHNKSHE